MNETSNFLASEIPLLMHEALDWIATRMEKKQKDRVWIENFVKVGQNINVFEEYDQVAMQLENNTYEYKWTIKALKDVLEKEKGFTHDKQPIEEFVNDYLDKKLEQAKEKEKVINHFKEKLCEAKITY